MHKIHKIDGITLLEAMLALTISASIILMGVGMYQRSKADNDYANVKANVDMLFEAMKEFYFRNCYTGGESGLISPYEGANISAPLQVDIYSYLINPASGPSYFHLSWPSPAFNSVVNYIDPGTHQYAYYAQFNPSVTEKKVNACYTDLSDPAHPMTTCGSSPTPIPGSKFVLWQLQVVVQMSPSSETSANLGLAGADCAVNSFTPGTVVNCGASTGYVKGGYLVWQRMPSYVDAPSASASLWRTNPRVNQLRLQYSHDPMYEMVNPSIITNTNLTTIDTGHPINSYMYYLCGG